MDNKNYWNDRYSKMKAYNVVGHRSWTYKQYLKETRRFFTMITPFLPKNLKNTNSTVLDFGCGIGRCIPLLMKFFDEYWGVDIIESVLERNKKQYNEHNFVLIRKDGTIPISKKFNMIFCNVVLQHVIDDVLLQYYIQQFRTLLKKDGFVLLIENVDQTHKKNQQVDKYIKFRSITEYKTIFKPYFTIKILDDFISTNEKHAILVARP